MSSDRSGGGGRDAFRDANYGRGCNDRESSHRGIAGESLGEALSHLRGTSGAGVPMSFLRGNDTNLNLRGGNGYNPGDFGLSNR
jgi:hypothetical protein